MSEETKEQRVPTGTDKQLLRCFAAYMRKNNLTSITFFDSDLSNNFDILIIYQSLIDKSVTVAVKNLMEDHEFLIQCRMLFEAENEEIQRKAKESQDEQRS